MTYEVIILGHLHMPLYFIGTFTEYSSKVTKVTEVRLNHCNLCHFCNSANR